MKKEKSKKRYRPGKTTLGIEFDDEDLQRIRKIAESDKRSVGFLIRHAIKYWLASNDAKILSLPFEERMRRPD